MQPVENLANRFEDSAHRWAKDIEAIERAYPIPRGSLDAEALDGFSGDEESNAVAQAGLRLLAGQAITHVSLQVWILRHACESPIEMPMGLALTTVARHYGGWSVKLVAPSGEEWGDRFEPTGGTRFPDYMLRIEPQAQLGEHRVDFCLTLDASIGTEQGQVRSATKRMVVECDGHDFHDRTKEQASRDRERDRLLQSFGFLVYRYTGRDIWNDVFKCAAEAVESLRSSVVAELSEGRGR
jgi:very-short-patch-repair endonuclease